MKNSLTKKILSVALAVTVIFGALPVFAVPSFAADKATVTLESAAVEFGEQFELKLTINDNPGMSSFMVRLLYDETVFSLVKVKNGDVFPEDKYGTFDSGLNQMWIYANPDESLITDDGVLCTYTFKVIKDVSGDYEITVKFPFDDGNATAVNSTVEVTAKTVTDISLASLPARTTYTIGDTLDTTGLTLTAKYSDGSTKKVTSGFTCSPLMLNTAGTQTITITYKGKTATFDVTVDNARVSFDDLTLKLNEDEDGYVVSDCKTSVNGELVIPSEYNGLPVTEIGYEAFKNCTGLTSVTIPDSVTSIGQYAFYWCTSLTSVTIPDSVTSIGYSEFAYCTSLTSVTIPDSVTEIGGSAFYNCTGLISVTIPDSVTEIGGSAFKNCTSLTSVTIPESVTYIDRYAFDGCDSKLVINGYTYSVAHDYAVDNDIAFNSIGVSDPLRYELNNDGKSYSVEDVSDAYEFGDYVIPSEYNGLPVTGISWYAFEGCTSLTSVTIPNSMTGISWYAFEGCTSLTSVTIPNSVTEIGQGAFEGCTSLTSVTIPDSVTEIDSYAFDGCTSLVSVTIPSSVTYIGPKAFGYDENYYDDELDEWVYPKIDGFVINGYSYSASHDYAVENDITFNSIGKAEPIRFELNNDGSGYVLAHCSTAYNIGEYEIPAEYNELPVTRIDEYAFSGCVYLTSVIIPDSVNSIGRGAFMGCVNLNAVNIPESVEVIDYDAFLGCPSLKSVTLPDNDMRFAGLVEDNTFTFGYVSEDGVGPVLMDDFVINGYTYSTAHEYAVANNIKFNSLGMSKNSDGKALKFELNEDGKGYTVECDKRSYLVGELVIPSVYNSLPVTTVGSFADCNDLTAVIIPDSVGIIYGYAFEGCQNINKILIPESITDYSYRMVGYYYVGSGKLGYYKKVEDLTIYGYEGSAAEEYASENGFEFVAITKATDESTGITVEGKLTENTVLTVKQLEVTDNKVTFDITLTENGKAVQPEGNVLVKIPVPAGFDSSECSVYRKEENGTYTDMEAVCDGTYLIFTTDHFSEYVVTTENLGFIYGDVNGDGQLTPSDVVLLRRYFANYDSDTETSTIEVTAGADVNGDGALTPSDVVLLRRYFANYNSDTGESTVVLGK